MVIRAAISPAVKWPNFSLKNTEKLSKTTRNVMSLQLGQLDGRFAILCLFQQYSNHIRKLRG